jgi:hypothetical protein
MISKREVVCLTLMMLVIYALITFVAVSRARAHSWYDQDCCHDRDCGPVSMEDVEELANGDWRYIPENKIFSKAEGRVRPSHDGKFHVCLQPHTRFPYCIYILQGT